MIVLSFVFQASDLSNAMEAALEGRFHNTLCTREVTDAILSYSSEIAAKRGLQLLAKDKRDLFNIPAALLVVEGRLAVAVRVPLVAPNEVIFSLYFVKATVINLPQGDVVHFRPEEYNYFAIDESTGKHMIFAEDQMKTCHVQNPIQGGNDYLCYGMQLIFKPSHQSCVFSLWRGDTPDNLLSRCQGLGAAMLDIERVGSNQVVFDHDGTEAMNCRDGSDKLTTSSMSHFAYQPVFVAGQCFLEGLTYVFRSSFLVQDREASISAEVLKARGEAYAAHREQLRVANEELIEARKEAVQRRGKDMTAAAMAPLFGLAPHVIETVKFLFDDVARFLTMIVSTYCAILGWRRWFKKRGDDESVFDPDEAEMSLEDRLYRRITARLVKKGHLEQV